MRTIEKANIHEKLIKNSKFITILIPITKESNIMELLSNIKEQYPKANHYCYAYKTEIHQKASDDKEPSGTAGVPMLNVLIKENMINILAITVRYFGGIKLGAGGLIRAYTQSIVEALAECTKIDLTEGYRLKIFFPYEEEKQVNTLLKKEPIIDQEYLEQITYTVLFPKEKISQLEKYTIQIVETLLIPYQTEK